MEQMQAQAEHVGTEMVERHRHRGRSLAAAVPARPATAARPMLAETLIIATGAAGQVAGPPDRSSSSRASASRPAPPATASSIAARRSSWSAAATPPSRRRSSSPTSPPRSPWSTAATSSAPRRSCRSACSRNPKIAVIWDHAVEEVLGDDRPGRRHRRAPENVKTGEIADVPCRRRLRRHRPRAGLGAVQGPARDGRRRLSDGQARLAPPPRSPASSPPATSPTTSTARR